MAQDGVSMDDTGAKTLTAQGFAAVRAKDLPQALGLFRRAAERPDASAETFLGLALTCAALKDASGFEAAADRALTLEPQNPRALILKGDALAAREQFPKAVAFYRHALRNAPQNPPSSLARELARAQTQLAALAAHYEDFLRGKLRDAGFRPEAAPRFALALDIMTGRTARAEGPQRPRMFFLPGLEPIGFFPRAATPFLGAVEQAFSAIRTELQAVLETRAGFAPYVQSDPEGPRLDYQGMADNPDWSAYYLWKSGRLVPEHAAQCPRTAEALAAVPLCAMPARGPMALFSWLRPGARIPPHTGMLNTRAICHLPLIVPPGCGFRVGEETRAWEEGTAWAFDDTFEHEAWNASDRLRVILLFEVWRPDVTLEERHWLCVLLGAIDDYAGEPPEWEI